MTSKSVKDSCLKLLSQYTKKNIVKITMSGDAAIFAALSIAKQLGYKTVLIPDQGGWLTYKTFPNLLGIKIIELPTDYGIINPEQLQQYDNAILLYSSYAGYFAAQSIGDIYKASKRQNILVVLDVSGALTHEFLCNGNNADIFVASFGRWKIVDLGYAGFLSAGSDLITKHVKASDIFKLTKIKNIDYELLNKKLNEAHKKLQFILQQSQEVKQHCNKAGFTIIHEKKEGLNVICKYKTDTEKHNIISFCKKNNLPYKECPLYIKVLEKAISIEIKRVMVESC